MDLSRYHRQMLLPGIGEEGQRRLAGSHALLVGCGALGTVIADALVRAGVGTLTIVDRDVVEITNLQRQVLFTEADVEGHVPKAEAARRRLAAINGQVHVRAHVADFNYRSAGPLVEGVDVILDGLDNFQTRYLLNDLAVSRGVPYVYGGAVGVTGMSMTVIPGETPCLRCLFPAPPPPGTTPTCDTAGVLGPAVLTIAAHQATQALKLLAGHGEAVDRALLSIDVWRNETSRMDVSDARSDACPCCGKHEYPYLEGAEGGTAVSLCGRNAVQIGGSSTGNVDLDKVADNLAPHGSFTNNGFLLHGTFEAERSQDGEPIALTLFPDGRAIVGGTAEVETARSIYARYVGV